MTNEMTSAQKVFDPIAFKETTRAQWDGAADAWNRWSPLLNRWLGPATEMMLDMTHVQTGSRVLDVAAGAGVKPWPPPAVSARQAMSWRPIFPLRFCDIPPPTPGWQGLATSKPW